jgi:glycosyltransferase involved in cell wall biosynthesis
MQKHLVFVSPRFLFPTDSGGRIRTTQILRGVKGGAFSVTLVMPSTESERNTFDKQIRTICDEHVTWEPKRQSKYWRLIKKIAWIFKRFPIPVQSDWDATGAATVRQVLDKGTDLVVFDFPHSAVLAPDSFSAPSVMFTHNIEAEIFHRHWQVARFPIYKMIWGNQYRKMLRFEKEVLTRFDAVVAVSDRDSDFFREEYGVTNCGVIPTGVDTEFFAYRPPEEMLQVVFCGSMDWMANVDGVEYFFDNVWSKIRDKIPAARMKVVGRAPPESLVKRICSAAPEWEFTGFVDDVRDHIGGSAAFVIPLRVGGGTRIKAFEAMAMGAPVVSTSIGIEGLPVQHGEHFLVADEDAAFAENVVALLTDGQLRTAISKSARRLVEEKHGFQIAAGVFEKICLKTVGSEQ